VALDGSEKAFETIHYLCSFKPFLKKKLVLHNILTRVPEYYYDLEKDPFNHAKSSRIQAWEIGYKAQMKTFMKKAETLLISAGFKPDAISVMIAERKKGIARDIMDEARKGYEALLIRRRGGAELLLSLALGSVSTKLVEKTNYLPVMVAGIQKVKHSLLIAVDNSEGAKRAVAFVAKIVEHSDCRIVLCTVLRGFDLYPKKNSPKKPIDQTFRAFEEIETFARDAEQILENVGIPKKNIVTKIIQGASSRTDAIVDAAKQENCDTIIFGRKGKSDVTDFDVGSVPWKVIHGAKEMTVWMIP
jgi:nucleotide-binding universal stress UspA family protein